MNIHNQTNNIKLNNYFIMINLLIILIVIISNIIQHNLHLKRKSAGSFVVRNHPDNYYPTPKINLRSVKLFLKVYAFLTQFYSQPEIAPLIPLKPQ